MLEQGQTFIFFPIGLNRIFLHIYCTFNWSGLWYILLNQSLHKNGSVEICWNTTGKEQHSTRWTEGKFVQYGARNSRHKAGWVSGPLVPSPPTHTLTHSINHVLQYMSLIFGWNWRTWKKNPQSMGSKLHKHRSEVRFTPLILECAPHPHSGVSCIRWSCDTWCGFAHTLIPYFWGYAYYLEM